MESGGVCVCCGSLIFTVPLKKKFIHKKLFLKRYFPPACSHCLALNLAILNITHSRGINPAAAQVWGSFGLPAATSMASDQGCWGL